MARVQYRLRKKIKRVAQAQSRLHKKELARLDEFHKIGAAVVIQRFWRHTAGAKEEQSLLRIIQQSKAILIQRAYRRFRARMYIRYVRKEYKQEKKHQNEVTVVVSLESP